MKLVPLGHRILVKRDDPETKTESGIVIAQDEKMAKYNQETGTLVAAGDDAWKAFRKLDDNGKEVNGKPWAKSGDKVWFSRNCGRVVIEPETKEEFLIMHDEDISIKLECEE